MFGEVVGAVLAALLALACGLLIDLRRKVERLGESFSRQRADVSTVRADIRALDYRLKRVEGS